MSSPYLPTSHKGTFGLIAAWTAGLVVLIGVIGIALWGFGVFTSDVKGAGDAIRQRNSAVNRVQKQEMFEQIAADYDGAVVNIRGYGKPATPMQETELRGLKQHCVSLAQQFNAESNKYTSRVWKSAGLPATLDPLACQGATS